MQKQSNPYLPFSASSLAFTMNYFTGSQSMVQRQPIPRPFQRAHKVKALFLTI